MLAGSSGCTAAAAAAAVVVLVFAAAQQPAQSRCRGVLMPGGVNTFHVLLFDKSFVNARTWLYAGAGCGLAADVEGAAAADDTPTKSNMGN